MVPLMCVRGIGSVYRRSPMMIRVAPRCGHHVTEDEVNRLERLGPYALTEQFDGGAIVCSQTP